MLELRDTSKVYSSKSRVSVHALKDVNLIFGDKGCNVILGPSGVEINIVKYNWWINEPTLGNLVYYSISKYLWKKV